MEEFVKIHPNGQWSLEKNWKKPQIKAMSEWVDTGNREHLDKLPEAKGKLKNDMLGTLRSHSESRVNPITKETEHKAYRAAQHADNTHNDKLTSWTTSPQHAKYWAGLNEDASKIMHAWIPEKHIHSYLPHVQEKEGHGIDEGEMLVKPHEFNIDKVKNIKAKAPWTTHTFGDRTITSDESKSMHGKPHPTDESLIWNHGSKDNTGYVSAPGFTSKLEGNDLVTYKNNKEHKREKLI